MNCQPNLDGLRSSRAFGEYVAKLHLFHICLQNNFLGPKKYEKSESKLRFEFWFYLKFPYWSPFATQLIGTLCYHIHSVVSSQATRQMRWNFTRLYTTTRAFSVWNFSSIAFALKKLCIVTWACTTFWFSAILVLIRVRFHDTLHYWADSYFILKIMLRGQSAIETVHLTFVVVSSGVFAQHLLWHFSFPALYLWS